MADKGSAGENAAIYNGNVVKRVEGNVGTPTRPGVGLNYSRNKSDSYDYVSGCISE